MSVIKSGWSAERPRKSRRSLHDSIDTPLEPVRPVNDAELLAEWIAGDRRRARNVCLIALYQVQGFDFNTLCQAFGMKKPAISLAISRTKAALQYWAAHGRYHGTAAEEIDDEEQSVDRQLRLPFPEA